MSNARLLSDIISTDGSLTSISTVTSDNGFTTSGPISAVGKISTDSSIQPVSYLETHVAVTSTTNATTVNQALGNTFSHVMSESTSFSFTNPPNTGVAFTFSIELIQDVSGSGYTVTWPTTVEFPAGTAPTLSPASSAIDVFVFTTRDAGATYKGFTAGQAMAIPV